MNDRSTEYIIELLIVLVSAWRVLHFDNPCPLPAAICVEATSFHHVPLIFGRKEVDARLWSAAKLYWLLLLLFFVLLVYTFFTVRFDADLRIWKIEKLSIPSCLENIKPLHGSLVKRKAVVFEVNFSVSTPSRGFRRQPSFDTKGRECQGGPGVARWWERSLNVMQPACARVCVCI